MTSENLDLLIKILSAGVIAALITGIFSLIISAKTNKRLEKIELIKQKNVMEKQKYEQLKEYWDNLVKNGKKFEFHGKPEQTMGCLRKVFQLDLDKFKYIQKEHEDHSYLFEVNENAFFEDKKETINNHIHEYVEKCTDSSDINEVVGYMDKISLEIEELSKDYHDLIKLKMSNILKVY